MSKIKVISIIVIMVMVLVVLGGCGSNQKDASSQTDASQQEQKGGPVGTLVDGVYKVEYDKYDAHDYKGQLELTVSDGKITDLKYDEVSKDGKLKSQDEQYKSNMEEASSTYPAKAYGELKDQVLSKQSTAIDTIAGATASTKNFKGLLNYAVNEMAKNGKTDPATIPAPAE